MLNRVKINLFLQNILKAQIKILIYASGSQNTDPCEKKMYF